MSQPDTMLHPGDDIGGNYTLLRLLGKGGMGEVWVAEDLRLGRKVAIKFFTSEFGDREKASQRFVREARVMARMRNPHVVTIYEFGFPEDETPYLVMELVTGETLFDRLSRDGRIEAKTAVHVARQMALALEEAHAAGVIHRDLKPENVLLSTLAQDPWYVKVVDFGLARSFDDTDESNDLRQLTTVAVILGTPAYMSPEQALGKDMDPRSDLYSLGVMLYQMITGALPVRAATAQEFLVQHQIQRPEPLHQVSGCEHLPQSLGHVVMGLLEKRPEARPSSAAALTGELAAITAQIDAAGMGQGAASAAPPTVIAGPSETPLPPGGIAGPPESDPAALDSVQLTLATKAAEVSESALAKPRLVARAMLGRDAELDMLLEQHKLTIKRAEPRVVSVQGAPGVGVSRLLMQFLPRAHKADPSTRILRLFPWDGVVDAPGRPVTDLFVRSTGLTLGDKASTIRARFREAFRKLGIGGAKGDLDQAARRAGEILGLLVGAPTSDPQAVGGETVVYDILEYGAKYLLGIFGDTPTILLIDNAEHMRTTTRNFLAGWLTRMKPARWLVLLGVHGGEIPELEDAATGARMKIRSLHLEALPDDSMQELARDYEGELKLDDGALSEVAKKAGGKPGVLHTAALEHLLGSPLKSYVRSSTAPEAEVLRIAAACGSLFPVELIDHLTSISCKPVLDLWVRQGVLARAEAHEIEGIPGYAFTSPEYHRVCREGLTGRTRIEVHDRAISWLNDRASGDNVLVAPRLLSHYIGKADLIGSLQEAERLALHALRIGAPFEASQAAGRVLSVLQKRATRTTLSEEEFGMLERATLLVSKVRQDNGDRVGAREVLQAVERTARRYQELPFRRGHARLIAGLAGIAVDADESRELLDTALEALGDLEDADNARLQTAAELHLAMAAAARSAGEISAADRALERSEQRARQGQAPAVALQALFRRADLAVYQGEHDLAQELLEKVSTEAGSADQPRLQAKSLLRRALLLGRLGKSEEATPYLQDARSLYEKRHDPDGLIEAALVEAEIALSRPDFWGARRALETIPVDGETRPSLAARRLEALGRALLATGEAERAQVYAAKSVELADRAHDTQTMARAQLLIYQARAASEDSGPDMSRGLLGLVRRHKEVDDQIGLGRTYGFTALQAAQGKLPKLKSNPKEVFEKAQKILSQAGCLTEARRLKDMQRRVGY
jgi:tRNA A-37 threonylcarbamoyl transferase component Bud32